MTPKDKAKKMYWNYYQNVSDTSFPEETAKQCALIAVDEIINNGGTKNIIQYKTNNYTNDVWYWLEVKEEINKL